LANQNALADIYNLAHPDDVIQKGHLDGKNPG